MPLITKKTYSRKNQEIHEEKEKENFDPFDELLSSPLKQDVQFKPLSFWNKKLNTNESSNTFKKRNCRLYETSDSDNPSPYRLSEKKVNKSKAKTRRKKNVLRNLNQNVILKNCDVSVSDIFKNFSSVNYDSGGKKCNDSYCYVTKKRQYNNFLKNAKPNVLNSSPKEDLKTFSISQDFSRGGSGSDTNGTFNTTVICNKTNESDKTLLENSFYNTCLQSSQLDSTIIQYNNTWGTENCSDYEIYDAHNETIKPYGTLNSTSENESCESAESEASDKETKYSPCPPCTNSKSALGKDCDEENISSSDISVVKDVCSLTSMMSDMSIVKEKEEDCDLENSTKAESDEDENMKDKKESNETLTSDMLRNVTRRKRLRNTHQEASRMSNIKEKTFGGGRWDSTVDSPLLKKDRVSVAPERFSCFSNPIFESTRVFDEEDREKEDDLGENDKSQFSRKPELSLNYSIALKPGKKWRRSMSVLKQIQRGTILSLENTKNKGKKFESFVQEMIDMQNDLSSFLDMGSEETIIRKSNHDTSVRRNTRNSLMRPLELEDEEESLVAFDKTLMNQTVKIVKPETGEDRPSAFRTALGLDKSGGTCDDKNKQNKDKKECLALTAKKYILEMCHQKDFLPFEEHFNEKTLSNCKKIGEGVYGEVYMYDSNIVLKILPIEGSQKVNGEPQKKFQEILSEVVSASKLSNLRHDKKNRTSGFSEMRRCWCVKGKYPKHLIDLWKQFDERLGGSENDSPAMFNSDQLFIILEMANGGVDLESYVFTSSEQTTAIFNQMALSLAVAEKAFQFEHRDLHWGNILVSPTDRKFTRIVLDNVEHKVPTKGVKVTIIDFTLSRLLHDGCVIFNDLSRDPDLFISHGDYQFEIYRMMQKAVGNDWSVFKPKTNIFWLHYTVDKMLNLVRYKNKRSFAHTRYLKKLKTIEGELLKYEDCVGFALKSKLL